MGLWTAVDSAKNEVAVFPAFLPPQWSLANFVGSQRLHNYWRQFDRGQRGLGLGRGIELPKARQILPDRVGALLPIQVFPLRRQDLALS